MNLFVRVMVNSKFTCIHACETFESQALFLKFTFAKSNGEFVFRTICC